MSSQLYHMDVEVLADSNVVELDFDSLLFNGGDVNAAKGSKEQSLCWITKGSTIIFCDTERGCVKGVWSFQKQISCVVDIICENENDHLFLVALTSNGVYNSLEFYSTKHHKVIASVNNLPSKCVAIDCFYSNSNFNQTEEFSTVVTLGFSPSKVLTFAFHYPFHAKSGTSYLSKLPKVYDMKSTNAKLASDGLLAPEDSNIHGVVLDYTDSNGKSFKYYGVDGNIIKTFYQAVEITCLKYFMAYDVLAVGYNVGCFHLFSSSTFELVFSSELLNGISAPVQSFVFQVPEEDPRKCIYLWIAYSTGSKTDSLPSKQQLALSSSNTCQSANDDFAALIMYQLTFDEEDCGLRTCRPWFQIDLRPDIVLKNENGFELFNRSRIISMGLCCDDNKLGAHSTSTQVYFSWQFDNEAAFPVMGDIESDELNRREVQIALFDLNCWYEAQMPRSVRVFTNQRFCPYFAIYNCSQISNAMIDDVDSSLLYFTVLPNSMRQFRYREAPTPSFCSFLCSYQFKCLFLTDSYCIRGYVESIQQTVLNNMGQLEGVMDSDGVDAMMKAAYLSKLLDQPTSLTNLDDISKIPIATKVKSLLDILAKNCDHNGLINIIKAIKLSENHNLTNVLSFYDTMQYLWLRVDVLSKAFSKYCEPLFNLEPTTATRDRFKTQFDIYFSQMSCFHALFCEVFQIFGSEQCPVSSEELEAISKLIEYYRVVRCLLDVNFLPEIESLQTELFDKGGKGFVFPEEEVDTLYSETILFWKQKFGIEGLLFERLLEILGIELDYPLKSFDSILKRILLNQTSSCSFGSKLALLNYIFMDISTVLKSPSNTHGVISHVSILPRDQNQNWNDIVNIIWYLDHGKPQVASQFLGCVENLSVLPKGFIKQIVVRVACFQFYKLSLLLMEVHHLQPVTVDERKVFITTHLSDKDLKMAASYVQDYTLLVHFLDEIENFQIVNLLIDMDWPKLFDIDVDKLSSFFSSDLGARFAYVDQLYHSLRSTVSQNIATSSDDSISSINKALGELLLEYESLSSKKVFWRNPKEYKLTKFSNKEENKKILMYSKVKMRGGSVRTVDSGVSSLLPSFQPRRSHKDRNSAKLPGLQLKVKELEKIVSERTRTDLMKSPAAFHLLSTPEVVKKRRLASEDKSSERGSFHESDCSPFLQRIKLNIHPEFEGVLSPNLSPIDKKRFPTTPMPRGRRTTQLAKSRLSQSVPKKGRVFVDEEISFRVSKCDQSLSSTEDHNATVLRDNEAPIGSPSSFAEVETKANRVNCAVSNDDETVSKNSFLFRPPKVFLSDQEQNFSPKPSLNLDATDTYQFTAPFPKNVYSVVDAENEESFTIQGSPAVSEDYIDGYRDRSNEIVNEQSKILLGKSVAQTEKSVEFCLEQNPLDKSSLTSGVSPLTVVPTGSKSMCEFSSANIYSQSKLFSSPLNKTVTSTASVKGVAKSKAKTRTAIKH